jgi:multifunctional beta-oxidation protein
MANFENHAKEGSSGSNSTENYEDPEDTEEIKAAKRAEPLVDEVTYVERDVLLYNLGIGAKVEELKWTYENADGFEVSHQALSFRLRRY